MVSAFVGHMSKVGESFCGIRLVNRRCSALVGPIATSMEGEAICGAHHRALDGENF